MQIGDKAPDFSVMVHNGQTISLHDFHGKKAVVLFFYPQDGTPICTQEACSFRDAYEQFVAAGAEVIGVSGNDNMSHRTFAQNHHLPYDLISDSQGALRELFGVPKTLGIFPGRVTYVIDQQGVIRHIFNSQLHGEQHVEEALKTVKMLHESQQA